MKSFFTLLFSLFMCGLYAQTLADFESIALEVDSFANGSDGSGGFMDGNIFLPNSYNAEWGSWSGWAISNKTDTLTPGFTNQYSAITGAGYDNSANYAVSFSSGENVLRLEGEAKGRPVEGLYITNNTYTYLSLRDGDGFAKKFGGATGDDPDYLLLTIKSYLNGSLSADSVNFYLADYRFEDNSQDYIIEDWTFIDLTSLGGVDSLSFTLSSTDVGDYGMNTPAYFSIDNLTTLDENPTSIKEPQLNLVEVYPNPTVDFIFVNLVESYELDVRIYDMQGRVVFHESINTTQRIDLNGLVSGNYFLEVQNEKGRQTKKIIKK